MKKKGTSTSSPSVHYPHPYDPKWKATIHRIWEEVRHTRCPIISSTVKEKTYRGKFMEYTYTNKKGKRVHVPEFCLLVTWLED